MANIIHRLGIKAPAAKVYTALTTLPGLSGWWTSETQGNPAPGGKLEFIFNSPKGERLGAMTFEVVKTENEKEVIWRCVDGPADWIGTHLEFKLAPGKEMTILRFGHMNWKEATESTAHCSMKWAVFLLSLREYVETGKGRPSPHDLKIDDWN
jgi:uncharacterized protein YndB with AHSA1/START domain